VTVAIDGSPGAGGAREFDEREWIQSISICEAMDLIENLLSEAFMRIGALDAQTLGLDPRVGEVWPNFPGFYALSAL